MSTVSDQFAPVRLRALERLRTRWGHDRKPEARPAEGGSEPINTAFLQLSDEDLDLALRVPTPAHLAGLKDALREMRAERFAALQEPPDRDGAEAPVKRRDLYAEIASEHFRTGMASWLTSIAPDHGLSATPADELEKMRDEMLYRLELVQTIARMLQHEADLLENQIKARRALDAGGEGR